MSPRSVVDSVRRESPLLRHDISVADAVRGVVASGLPALPVVDDQDRYAGIFGEREFIEAVFPGYVKTLGYAAFVPQSIEEALDKRRSCARDAVARHMNTEHVDVPVDVSDIQLAETFISHRILLVPLTQGRAVAGVVTRADFFGALADQFLAADAARP